VSGVDGAMAATPAGGLLWLILRPIEAAPLAQLRERRGRPARYPLGPAEPGVTTPIQSPVATAVVRPGLGHTPLHHRLKLMLIRTKFGPNGTKPSPWTP
jgi:hypothetical protein